MTEFGADTSPGCCSCDAPVRWVPTINGPMKVDPDAHPRGNVVIHEGGHAMSLRVDDADTFRSHGEPLYRRHACSRTTERRADRVAASAPPR